MVSACGRVKLISDLSYGLTVAITQIGNIETAAVNLGES